MNYFGSIPKENLTFANFKCEACNCSLVSNAGIEMNCPECGSKLVKGSEVAANIVISSFDKSPFKNVVAYCEACDSESVTSASKFGDNVHCVQCGHLMNGVSTAFKTLSSKLITEGTEELMGKKNLEIEKIIAQAFDELDNENTETEAESDENSETTEEACEADAEESEEEETEVESEGEESEDEDASDVEAAKIAARVKALIAKGVSAKVDEDGSIEVMTSDEDEDEEMSEDDESSEESFEYSPEDFEDSDFEGDDSEETEASDDEDAVEVVESEDVDEKVMAAYRAVAGDESFTSSPEQNKQNQQELENKDLGVPGINKEAANKPEPQTVEQGKGVEAASDESEDDKENAGEQETNATPTIENPSANKPEPQTVEQGEGVEAQAGGFIPFVKASSFTKVLPEDIEVKLYGKDTKDPFYNVTIKASPVARINLSNQEEPERIRAMFLSETYPKAIVMAMTKANTTVESVLNNCNAEYFAAAYTKSEMAENMRNLASEQIEASNKEKLMTLRDSFLQCLSMAVAGMNKNFFGNELGNPLKEKFWGKVVEAGMPEDDATELVEAAFAEGANAFFNIVSAKAISLMDMHSEAREQLATAIAASGTVGVDMQIESFADKLATGNFNVKLPSNSILDEVRAETEKPTSKKALLKSKLNFKRSSHIQ